MEKREGRERGRKRTEESGRRRADLLPGSKEMGGRRRHESWLTGNGTNKTAGSCVKEESHLDHTKLGESDILGLAWQCIN
jgi:hypothetical protein